MTKKKKGRQEIGLQLLGSQIVLVIAATFMLVHWSFESSAGQSLAAMSTRKRKHAADLNTRIYGMWARLLDDSNLLHPPTRIATRAFVRRRATIVGNLTLTIADWKVVIVALEACHAEFRGDSGWDELASAAPGALYWFDLGLDDLRTTANLIQAALPSEVSP